jgi:hypothetical protein
LGFVIFDGTAPCYYRCRLCFDAGQVLVILNFPFLYCTVVAYKMAKVNRLNRFHKIVMNLMKGQNYKTQDHNSFYTTTGYHNTCYCDAHFVCIVVVLTITLYVLFLRMFYWC